MIPSQEGQRVPVEACLIRHTAMLSEHLATADRVTTTVVAAAEVTGAVDPLTRLVAEVAQATLSMVHP